ncbi:hypothetical protein Tco_1141408 [Tanacetum coccineum]
MTGNTDPDFLGLKDIFLCFLLTDKKYRTRGLKKCSSELLFISGSDLCLRFDTGYKKTKYLCQIQTKLWQTDIEGYTEEIVQDYEYRLDTIFGRQVNRVHILDFEGLTVEMRQALTDRLRMEYTRVGGDVLFTSHAWRRLFEIQGPLVRLHTAEEMAGDGFEAYWAGSLRGITDKGDLSDYWARIYSDGDFLRVVPTYTSIRDPLRRLCHRLIAVSISGRGQAPKKVTATDLFYLRRRIRGRRRLAEHFGLAWVASGPKRQPIVAAGAPEVAEGAPDVDKGWKRIFKKKAKNNQNQARDGKDQVKSKSKVNHMKKIQLEGLKLPNPKLYCKNQKTRVEIAKGAKFTRKL